MALRSSAMYSGRNVKKTFIFEVPDFMHEAELLLACSESGRELCSRSHSFSIDGFPCSGSISVELKDGNVQFGIKIYLGNVLKMGGGFEITSLASDDVECIIDATMDGEGFQFTCGEECAVVPGKFLRSIMKGKSHLFVKTVPFDELKKAVPDWSENLVRLTITSTVSFYKPRSSSEWVKTEESAVETYSPNTAPFLRHVLDRKFSDLVIQCDGNEFPVHRFVLKCTSPVFAAMLETDMKETASGRVQLEDVSSECVERMIGFIYTGTLSVDEKGSNEFSDDLITELLYCAEKYEIPDMMLELLARMRAKLSAENAVKFLNAAELYGAEQTAVADILDFCKKNLVMLPKGPELQEFVVKHVKDLF